MRPNIPFSIELPFEVWEKAGESGKERRIGGIISTESKDRQSEVVLQNGLDLSEFLKSGFFNDNHSKETTGIVGYPEKVQKIMHKGRPAHYVEGYLLKDYPRADEIWKLANALQKTGRRLGFSIEGAVGRRSGDDGSTIVTAKVRNVAITNCPVNTDTCLEVLAKSMIALAQEGDDFEQFLAWKQNTLHRAMMAGQAINTPPAAHGEGFPLRAESLENVPKKKKRKKKLTKSEAFLFLTERYPDMTRSDADRILAYVADRQFATLGGE